MSGKKRLEYQPAGFLAHICAVEGNPKLRFMLNQLFFHPVFLIKEKALSSEVMTTCRFTLLHGIAWSDGALR